MDDDSAPRIDHPDRLCNAVIGIVDDLEKGDVIDDERAAELRSEVYRAIDVPEE